MAFGSTDDRALLLPLIAGFRDPDDREHFLRILAQRTRAARAALVVRSAVPAPLSYLHEEGFARDGEGAPPLDLDVLGTSGLLPLAALRAGRVYALDEMFALGDPEREAEQSRVRRDQQIRFARFMRIVVTPELDAWIILAQSRADFDGADSALLSSLGPFLATALAALAQRTEQDLRVTMAEEALALLQVAQVAADAKGRVIASDARASARHGLHPGQRLPQFPETARLAVASMDDAAGRFILLRPMCPPAVGSIGLIRDAPAEAHGQAAAIIARQFGLSQREAALAEALSRGVSLIEAGARLKLTNETTRNYSKRIYAKTGTRGQADLVRLILTGLAPFASPEPNGGPTGTSGEKARNGEGP